MGWQRRVVVAVVSCGCYGSPARPSQPQALAKPACQPIVKIELGDTTTARALLDGTDLKLEVEHEEGKSDGDAVVYPYSAHSVLMAWTAHGHYGRPNGSGTLYEVDCTAKTAKVFFAGDGDFGHSAMTGDGKTIYFSHTGGIRALDVATKQTRQVTPPVELKTCGDRGDATDEQGNPVARIALSAVRKLDEAEALLIYEDGDSCGFEGDWDASTMYLDHPETPGGKPYAPRGVGPVAVDAGGVVWAIAAADLWSSSDAGDHWQRVTLPAAESDPRSGDSDAGPLAMFADARRPGHVLVETAKFGPMGMLLAGRLLVTRDGGRTWTAIASPPDESDNAEFALRDGSVDHPLAWGFVHRDTPDGYTAVHVAWEYANVDDGWSELEQAPPKPGPMPVGAKRGGDVFTPSANGLLRSRGTGKPTRLFPH